MPTTLEELLPLLADIAANPSERRSLETLAAQANSSASSFQRTFTRLVGESAKRYSLRLQLECAALYLVTTTWPILEISAAAGFGSHEGFTRAFRRHFDTSPSGFRRQHAALGRSSTHVGLARKVGPCIGIFRQTSTVDHQEKSPTMNYEITQQPAEESVFLYQSERCSHEQVAETLGRLLPAVFQHAIKHGLEFCSPPTAIYQDWGPGMVTLQAGLFVVSADPTGEVEVRVLPAGEAVTTIHEGSYDGLGKAHAALEQHIEANGLAKAGSAREVYLTDPGEVPNPDDWKTQVVWPVSTRS